MLSKQLCLSRSVHLRYLSRKLLQDKELHSASITNKSSRQQDSAILSDESEVQSPSNAGQLLQPISLSRQQLVQYILNSVIYQDDHILAFNKPNGLPILTVRNTTFGSSVIYLDKQHLGKCETPEHSSENTHHQEDNSTCQHDQQETNTQPHETSLSVFDILTDLKQLVNSSALEIGLTLPRLYSGVMLLTKTEEAKNKLRKYIETKRSQKLFYQSFSCVTIGIPSHIGRNVETVACKLVEMDGKTLTVPADDVGVNMRKKGMAIKAEVELQCLAQNSDLKCAHVQIKPTRDKWDLLEWYCTRRLCSVLGDHVYSSRVGSVLGVPAHVEPHIALPKPQNLPKQVLQKLNLKRDYVSSVPLHLHRGLVELCGIPNKKSEMITISAPLPDFFSDSLQRLDLHKGDR